MLVVDASVLIADMRPSEPYHREARAVLDRIRSGIEPAHSPVIALAEVAGGISRATGRPDLARRLTDLLRRTQGITFLPVDEILGSLAAETAAVHQVRGCDAVYIALAQQLGAILVTLDGAQRERVPSGVVATTPAQALAAITPGAAHSDTPED